MTLELEINAATRAFFPENAWEYATPLQCFELISSNSGESQKFIGQLVPRALHRENNKHDYLLVFRMEFSEKDTNFFAFRSIKPSNFVNYVRYLTFEEACALSLSESFPDILSDPTSGYLRPWLPPFPDTRAILFKRGMRGEIYRKNWSGLIKFRCPNADNADVDSLLDLSNQEFHQAALALYTDKQSELRFSLEWMYLSSQERDEIAFKCKHGNWHELRQIATWLFQLWLGQQQLPDDEYTWRFASYDTSVRCENSDWSVWRNNFLLNSRTVLTGHFKPNYIDANGVKEDVPRCIEYYVTRNELGLIALPKPTQHEILEAGLQLSQWTNANLPAEEAMRLLDF